MTSLFWTFEAIQDRLDIYDYIEADNPVAARHLDESFSDQASLLARYPVLGRTGRVPGTRELVVRILNVVNVARLWPASQKSTT